MIRKFINKDGEVRLLEVRNTNVPETSRTIDGVHYQRIYAKPVIWLNAWITRRNADLLKYL